MKVSIGVDVGKSGGIITLVDGKFKQKYLVPVIGTVVDVPTLSNIFRGIKHMFKNNTTDAELEVIVALEQVHAIFGVGAGSTFEFGRVFGLLEGIIAAHGFRYVLVQPKIWQKDMFLGIPEIRKPSKEIKKKDGTSYIKQGTLETKKMALVAVNRLFPDVNLSGTSRATTPHDGLVDAILIAEWARRHV